MEQKILVVDDDKMNLRMAEFILKKNGYSVIKSERAKNALEILNEQDVELILLDIEMPEMNGFELMQILQEDEKLKKIPVIFLTADRSAETEEKCFTLGAVDYIGKPFIPTIMLQRVKRTIELEAYRKNLEKMVEEQLRRITQLQRDVIIIMANLIESRDGTTGEHIKNTSSYVDMFIDALVEEGIYKEELTKEFVSYVKKAAPLHDVGKITVSDLILQKAGGFTEEEYAIMKMHAKAGKDIILNNMSTVADQKFVKIAAEIAGSHHEKWDGSGYPEGLKENQIPLSARIVSIADVMDALVAKRPYKEGMSVEDALSIMKKGRGISFEPILFDVFEKIMTK
jgi:putative two-component system response regulator